jgi:hypothetical protein
VEYVFLCFVSGVAGGLIGRSKGSSFWIWATVCAVVPFLGIVAALVYRSERDEPRRDCPNCGKVVPIYQALCTRCGAELDYPDRLIEPESVARP